ncbi:hypothetical protein Cgig2_010073 [Carnegiea gigantea]|uniref:Protein PIN-LIKES 3 n=1 Tax=Carnegiea gigantea TaxID=171969 RepID=A0A9Q1JUG8_9CARY|nr:hypothetical protein Cgig2_010073 [Carnegiea gigantea]
MALLQLFVASSMPVIKVLLITALGSCLALEHINILGEDARKHLNKIVFFVFNPTLVASNLAKALKHESVTMMWFMALNILITVVIGSALGFIIVHVTKVPVHLRGLVLGCCAAGNMGNMLLIIIPTICMEKGTPFGDPDECHTNGMAYASLSMAIGAIYLWSYVYNMVRMCANRHSKEVEVNDSSVKNASNGTPEMEARNSKVPLLSTNQCKVTVEHHVIKLAPPSVEPVESEGEEGMLDKTKQAVWRIIQQMNLKTLFAPSTIAAIVGFIVGLVPVIRRLLIGEHAPLHAIQDSALLLGDGSIPSVTLIMGGNLLKGLRRSDVQKSLIVGIIIARYVALPVIGTVIVKSAINLGLVPKDPLYQFVLLLQFAVPPAMNIGTITQLFGAGENECSIIMLWTYALASVALTLWSTFFMWLVT